MCPETECARCAVPQARDSGVGRVLGKGGKETLKDEIGAGAKMTRLSEQRHPPTVHHPLSLSNLQAPSTRYNPCMDIYQLT